MKKRMIGLIFCLVSFLFSTCPGPSNPGSDYKEPDQEPDASPKTLVCFVNNNDFSVSIYSDASRLHKILDTRAWSQSSTVEMEPNLGGALFFPTFDIVIEDAHFPYEGEVIIARIDEKKTNVITIPSLEESETVELDKPLTNDAYIRIQNNSASSLALRQGSMELLLEASNSTILNGSETGLYKISAGSVSQYSLRQNTINAVSFPETVTAFAAARLYSFSFDGASLVLLAEKNLTLAGTFVTVPGETLSQKMSWLGNNAESGGHYVVRVDGNEDYRPTTFSYSDSNITIKLKGNGTIRRTSRSKMFTVSSDVTLVLYNNITLKGAGVSPYESLISVDTGGTLFMNGGTILGNTSSSGSYSNGTNMTSVLAYGTVIMNGGTISSDTTEIGSSWGTRTEAVEYGVLVANDGTFTMNGGTISANKIGVVMVGDGAFTMNGGTISGNGTGVSIERRTTFTMNGGSVSSNDGSGVFVGGIFIMNDGTISNNGSGSNSVGNSGSRKGGGVYVGGAGDSGTFIMRGGIVSRNTAYENGGGVYIFRGYSSGRGGQGRYFSGATFIKTGGIITGYNDDPVNGNLVVYHTEVKNDSGHAVCVSYGGSLKRKETTAGSTVKLAFDGSDNPNTDPTWSGDWDY
jgi:hypothetical protein